MFFNNYTTYPYGHDYGNSKTCGVTWIGNQQYALDMPSALAAGSYDALQAKVASTSSANLSAILNQRAHTLQLSGRSYYVGNLAIEQCPNAEIADLTSRGDVSRYWSDRNLALLLATSGTLIREAEYGLAVVANLPIATHNDINIKAVKTALDGDHVFFLDGVKRTAHITVKKTIMEGAGANIAFGPGGNKKVGVVDIGGRTTDAYLVTGQVPVMDMCKTDDAHIPWLMKAIRVLAHRFLRHLIDVLVGPFFRNFYDLSSHAEPRPGIGGVNKVKTSFWPFVHVPLFLSAFESIDQEGGAIKVNP